MKTSLRICVVVTLVGLGWSVIAQAQSDDPFDGGFSMNYTAEFFGMGKQADSLYSWGFNWISGSGLDSIRMEGGGNFPESYQCGGKRDIAAADFDGDFIEEVVTIWNKADGSLFIGIPTIDPETLEPVPGGWSLASPAIPSGALYATDTLADLLVQVRVVAGNFYGDRASEFVTAYLALDSTVTLTVWDVDSATMIPYEKATVSDQSINTDVPLSQRIDILNRFDIATGDFDGDGLDEILLVATLPGQYPATDIMVDVYDYDTLGHDIVPVSKRPFRANNDPAYTCLRRLAVTTGNFEPDSLDEIAILHRWAHEMADSAGSVTMNVLKLSSDMTIISDSLEETFPSLPRWVSVNGMDGVVDGLTVFNGELIAGGNFATAAGVPANKVARWDGTGTGWQSMGADWSYRVWDLTVYDGDLIACGELLSDAFISRWNGSDWQTVGSGMNHTVYSMAEYGGELIACGKFTVAGGVSANRIARWNGTNWQPLGSGMNDYVNCLAIYNGKLIAGGQFTTAGGNAANRIAAWNGSSWSALGSGIGSSAVDEVNCLAVYDGKLIAGGWFTTAGGKTTNYIAAWNGSSWSALGSGVNSQVWDLDIYDGRLIAAGAFTHAGGTAVNYIAAWNGSSWSSLGSGMTGPYQNDVHCLTNYDGMLVAGGYMGTAGGVSANRIAMWDGSSWSSLGRGSELPMDIVSGSLYRDNADPSGATDELLVTGCRENGGNIEQYIKGYEFDTSAVPATLCMTADMTVVSSIVAGRTPHDLYAGRRTMALEDVTGDGRADLSLLFSDNTDTIGMGLFEFYPDTSSTCVMDSVIMRNSWATSSDNLSELILVDLDTATVVIGAPQPYHLDSMIMPLAIINAPPVHYDILDDTTWDVSRRYTGSFDSTYDAFTQYFNSTSTLISTSTEMHRDWGVSAGVKGWAETGGFSISAHLEAKYGEGFSKQRGYSEQITFGNSNIARPDDRVLVLAVSYDILEYPVIRNDEIIGHVVVVSPSELENGKGWEDGSGYPYLIPNHEVENILSYPPFDDIANNPMVARENGGGIMNELVSWQVSNTVTHWYLGQQKIMNESGKTSWDLSTAVGITAGYESEFKLFGLGWKGGFEVSLGASYALGEISTFTTSFGVTDSLHVKLGQIDIQGDDSGNRKYHVIPYAYWANNGALVMDYAVEPEVADVGGDNTWWQNHYSDPDPALILPWRLDIEKYGAPDPEESRYQTKEIVFIPTYPEVGDTVLISARVHNFSIVPTPSPVSVSFYLGDPHNGGVLLKDKNTGDSIFVAVDTLGAHLPLEPQRTGIASMVWLVPGTDITSCQRIWCLIDPLDSISPEVHDNDDPRTNNKGWKLLRVNTTTTCVDRDGDGWEESAYRCCDGYSHWDNCPTVPNPGQEDINGDGIGDACQACCFGLTGNVDGDPGDVCDIGDLTALIGYLFIPPYTAPVCMEEANADGEGSVDIGDLTALIGYLFIPPFTPPASCP